MLARDLIATAPTIRPDASVLDAVRLALEHHLPAVVVEDKSGTPAGVIPLTQLLWGMVPGYIREDPALVHVVDEAGAEEHSARLAKMPLSRLSEINDAAVRDLPTVLPKDTLLEVAFALARHRCPVLMVQDETGTFHGVITASRAAAAIAEAAGVR